MEDDAAFDVPSNEATVLFGLPRPISEPIYPPNYDVWLQLKFSASNVLNYEQQMRLVKAASNAVSYEYHTVASEIREASQEKE